MTDINLIKKAFAVMTPKTDEFELVKNGWWQHLQWDFVNGYILNDEVLQWIDEQLNAWKTNRQWEVELAHRQLYATVPTYKEETVYAYEGDEEETTMIASLAALRKCLIDEEAEFDAEFDLAKNYYEETGLIPE